MIYMKKLVTISVLFALLATAAFAQWSNEWKLGLSAAFATDMFYAASNSGETVTTQTGSDTTTVEWGKYAKGVSHFFPNQKPLGFDGTGDPRLGLDLSNSGENYAIRVNIDIDGWATPAAGSADGWWRGGDFSVFDFLSKGISKTDWGIKGTAGIFSAAIGPWGTEAAFVGTNAIWGSWIGWNKLNRFGVWRADGAGDGDGWVHSNHFRTMDTWGNPFSVGIALGDNYKFTLGYKLAGWTPTIGSPSDSKSSMNGTFMLSGSPVEMINFDLFYSIQGQDGDTYARPLTGPGYSTPDAKWKNLLGAYVQINGIENLFVSIGYTASFNVYEAGSYVDPVAYAAAAGPPNTQGSIKGSAVTFNAPIYSSIDLRLGYSGIDKVGLKFLTNVSLANTKGQKADSNTSNSSVNFLFDESTYDADGTTEDWFHWMGILQAKLGFIDGVDLEVSLGDSLGVLTTKSNTTAGVGAAAVTTKTTDITTENEFRATVGAKYGIGNVTLGAALYLSVTTTSGDFTSETSGFTTGTTTVKGNDTIVKFGIPITFKVSF
jgi:hypothetical protein